MPALSTAISGLNAATAQLTASVSNVANAQSVGALSAQGALNAARRAYQPVTVTLSAAATGGVIATTVPVSPATVPAYDPDSPDADAQGLVAAPNVDPAQEAVTQISSLQAFRASLAVIRAQEDVQKRLLAVV